MELQPEGHAIDKQHPDIIYVPRDVHFDLQQQTVSWPSAGGRQTLKLLADKIYVRPSGYQVRMEQPSANRAWRLIGTVAEGTLCHKPCTVSGGGKSEISKSISDAIIHGPVFTADFKKDFDQVADLLHRDYSDRFKDPSKTGSDKRPILSSERSLGSVIKLFTPVGPRLFGRIQPMAPLHSAIHPRTGFCRETVLQTGLGRQVAGTFQRGHHQWHARQ